MAGKPVTNVVSRHAQEPRRRRYVVARLLERMLDEAIEYLADDELLEVTPESYRIRKRILDTEDRGKQTKKIKEQLEEA